MKHHGERVDWEGWLIGETKAARHLVGAPQYDGMYDVMWDSDGFGDAIWFDTVEEASAFIAEKFPLSKTKKDRAKQTRYMPIAAETVYRQLLGLRRIVKSFSVGDREDRIAVVEEETGNVVDDHYGYGYKSEEEAWAGVARKFSYRRHGYAYWAKRFDEFPQAKGILERLSKHDFILGSEETCDFANSRCMVLRFKEPVSVRKHQYTDWETPDGKVIYDKHREYENLKKTEGEMLANAEASKWKPRVHESEVKIYQYLKFWEVAGIVLTGHKHYEGEAIVKEPDVDPTVVSRYQTLEDVFSVNKADWEIVYGPRDCVVADWSCVEIPSLGIAKHNLGLPIGCSSRIWTEEEIADIALETQRVEAGFLLWKLHHGCYSMLATDSAKMVKDRIERVPSEVVLRLLEHNKGERKLAEFLESRELSEARDGLKEPIQGELF